MPEPFSSVTDIAMSPEGDLIIEDGDLKLASGLDWFIQEVIKILRTSNPEWELHPNIGASLEDYIGQPNTRATAADMAGRIKDKITAENLSVPFRVRIRPVPISRDSIEFNIFLDVDGQEEIVAKTIFDITGLTGIQIKDETKNPTEETIQEAQSADSGLSRNPYLGRL